MYMAIWDSSSPMIHKTGVQCQASRAKNSKN